MKKLTCFICLLFMGFCLASVVRAADSAALADMTEDELATYLGGLAPEELVQTVVDATNGEDIALGAKVIKAFNQVLATGDRAANEALAKSVIDGSLYVTPGVWTGDSISVVFMKDGVWPLLGDEILESKTTFDLFGLGNDNTNLRLLLTGDDDDDEYYPPTPISGSAYYLN